MGNYNVWTKKTWHETKRELETTFRKWGVADYAVESFIGKGFNPRKFNQTEQELTVTVRYTRPDGVIVRLTSSAQDRAIDNFRALYLAIERMRLIDAAGLTDIVRQAYAQLPSPTQRVILTPPADDPYAVIGADRHDSLEAIERVWKARLWSAHPDHGGTAEKTAALNAAMDAIRKEKAQ